VTIPRGHLLGNGPMMSLDQYTTAGGGDGLRAAHRLGPEGTTTEIRRSRLRGRGGAGFATGIKWSGLRAAGPDPRYIVCNAAEGEPGTFKDRYLIRTNPYQLLEGIAIAVHAAEAAGAFIGIKARFAVEAERLEQAASEMGEAGMLGELAIAIVHGPDDYLFGEEKALLEVIEGRDPLPRIHPPYIQGLFEGPDGETRPVAVNNVETLSNVPHILANGADWFRSLGTDDSPGTMVFTVGGDVQREAVVELEMGTRLDYLVMGIAGGPVRGRSVQVVANGVSNRALPAAALDVPLDFESLRVIGSGLGSGGFTVYDDTACPLRVAEALSRFLAAGSCGQCPPCKIGTKEIRQRFAALAAGNGGPLEVEELAAWSSRVTDANRCGLGAGQQAVADGFLAEFTEHLALHATGSDCGLDREITAPVIDDWDEAAHRFTYASQ